MTDPPEGRISPNIYNCCLAANPGRVCATIICDPMSSSIPRKYTPTLGPGMSSQKNAAHRESSSSELWDRGFSGRVGWGGARDPSEVPGRESGSALRISTMATRIKRMSKPEIIAATNRINPITQLRGDSYPRRYMRINRHIGPHYLTKIPHVFF